MKKIRIITDGAADFSPEDAEALGIRSIPIKVTFNGEEFIPGVNLSNTEFYERLKTSAKLPSTSLINEQIYAEVIEEELSAGNSVFVMALSSGLSGSYAALERAAAQINSPDVQIFDTKAVTILQRLIVEEAAGIAASGANLQELKEQAEALRAKARLYAVINDVTNLVQGGRLSAAAGLAATALKIKPVVAITDGLVKAVGKAFGVRRATDLAIGHIKNVDFGRKIFFGHSDCPDRLGEFAAAVKKKTGIGDCPVYELGPVIGTHSGQGCVGIAYFEK